jgi:predicted nucleic acid-binding protein
MIPYFIDSAYLIALEDKSDQFYSKALNHWKLITKNSHLLVTTAYILDEVATFFNKRGFHSKAVSIGEYLIQSSYIKFIHIDEHLFHQSWIYFKKHIDKSYSLTDCISFLTMKNLDIQTALTFDKHFIQAGFNILPD